MLLTLDEITEYLSIDPSNIEYDDFLEAQELLISSAIENYCARKFLQDDYVQTFYLDQFDKYPQDIWLYHFPVQSITSIFEDTEEITEYRLVKNKGIISRTEDDYKQYWFSHANKVEITYSAGYTSLPEEIKAVILNLIEERYNKKKAGMNVNFGNNVQSVAIPGVMNIQFDYTLQSNERKSKYGMILGDWINVLDPFRSERALGGEIHRVSHIEEA